MNTLERELQYLAEYCDLSDDIDGQVKTTFIRNRIAAIRADMPPTVAEVRKAEYARLCDLASQLVVRRMSMRNKLDALVKAQATLKWLYANAPKSKL